MTDSTRAPPVFSAAVSQVSSPSTAHSAPAAGLVGTTVQCTRCRESRTPPVPVLSACAETGRDTREPTEATGVPVASAMVSATPADPAGLIRTRRVVAPTACSATSVHANGNRVASALSGPAASIPACSAASSRAGCRPKPSAVAPASAGRSTSANTSAPRRQAARSPWKAGP